MNSITKRWVRNGLMFTIIILIIVDVVFIFYSYNAYYNNVRQAIMSRINTIDGQLNVLSATDSVERALSVRRMVEDFDEKSKFEIMLIDYSGRIVSTSSGFRPTYTISNEDFEKAKQGDNGIGEYIGKNSGGERVMSICYIIPNPAGNIVAIRFVTSLTLVFNRVIVTGIVSSVFLLVIILFSIFSGLYFVRSIVIPLGNVEATATKIAAGNFDTRLESKYNDEIGRLCTTINHMAEELGKTEQIKNDFISSVSHELRTPLTSIKGWIETLAKVDNPKDETYQRGIKIVMAETNRLYSMVEELLDFSRIQNKGLALTKEKLDIVAEVTDVVIMVEQRAVLENVNIEYDEPLFAIPVFGDKNRLKQVFVNILDNSLKYSPKGSQIKVATIIENGNVKISFGDCGQGIAPEDLEHVRTRFYKGKGAVRGSGIGLAVVDEIVKAHDGFFTIDSQLNVGTVVTVVLPLSSNIQGEIL